LRIADWNADDGKSTDERGLFRIAECGLRIADWNADDGKSTDERGLFRIAECGMLFADWNADDGKNTDERGLFRIAECGLLIADWNADDGKSTDEYGLFRIAECGLRNGTRMMGKIRMNADYSGLRMLDVGSQSSVFLLRSSPTQGSSKMPLVPLPFQVFQLHGMHASDLCTSVLKWLYCQQDENSFQLDQDRPCRGIM
jgi:hypothetical protein